MFKSSKRGAEKKNEVVSLLLVAALVITGALAYLTAKDSAENKFTVGNVDITLTEPEWDKANPDGTLENIVSGQVIAKDPTITNTGRNDAYVYMMVQVPKADEISIAGNADSVDDYQLFSYTINNGWTLIDEKVDANDANNYYLYAYNTALAPEGTATLFNEVTYANTTSDFEEANLSIEVTAYAIQSNFYNGEASDAESAWALYANQNSWDFPTNLAVAHYSLKSYSGKPVNNIAYVSASDIIQLPNVGISSYYGKYAFAGWSDETGKSYDPGASVAISDLLITDPDTEEVVNLNPVLVEKVSTIVENPSIDTETELPVKLVPIDKSSTATIERYCIVDEEPQTFIETYNEIVCVTCGLLKNTEEQASHHSYCMCGETTYTDRVEKDRYDYVAPLEKPYDEWYIYGIKENTTVDEFFSDYVKVQGDGYATITTVSGDIVSTGAVVEVYNRNGTETTDDDTLVEQFYVILFGDITCDGKVDDSDRLAMRRVLCNVGSWKWYSRRTPVKYMWKAGDMNTDEYLIDANDSAHLNAVLAEKMVTDQTTGISL